MDIPGALSTIKAAIDAAKILRETDRAWDEVTFKLQIIELISAMSDAQTAISDLNVEVRNRDEKIHELQRKLDSVGSVVYRTPFYWRVAAEGQPEDGPFCQACLDSTRRLVRVQKTVTTHIWKCAVCRTEYRWRDEPPEPPVFRPSR